MTRLAIILLAWLLLLPGIWGCDWLGGGQESKPPAAPPPRPKPAQPAKKAPAKAPEPVVNPTPAPQEYVYYPAGKPDPFRPFIVPPSATLKDKKKFMALTPLQKLDISQLKLVAIIQRPGGSTAMVQDAGGKSYIIVKGTLLGRNDGQVSAISGDTVFVKEIDTNFLGEKNPVIRKLEFPKSETKE
ncbi:MAG: pilus assembly protein PilP [Deltaproteobacteria bacterium]|nr:pilus assembly protein PilP [Deltaproteobacteria bacterium]